MSTKQDGEAGTRGIERVLYILQSTGIGGMETFCADQAQELVRRGCQVRVILPETEKHDVLAARFAAGGTAVTRLDVYPVLERRSRFPRLRYLSGLVTRLIPLLRSWRPDVVHFHRGTVVGGLPAITISRLFSNAVVVFSEHDVPFPGLKPQHRLSTWFMDRMGHGLIAVSRYNAKLRMAGLGAVRQRFASILNGIPIREATAEERAAHRAAVREQYGIGPDSVVIGCLVRLVEGKGLETLLQAFGRLRPGRDITLLLVGDGPLRSDLERQATELGVADALKLAGFQKDPLPFLDAMDIFALAVPAGTMSIALLEAMARGLPSVITFCGPEEAVIHEETGLCAPPNDADGLADALERLVDNATYRTALGQAAAGHVRTHFSITRCMNDHLEVYQAVRSGPVPARLRADGPPDPRPGGSGGRCRC